MIAAFRTPLFAAAAFVAMLTAGCVEGPSPVVRTATLSHPHAAEIWSDKCGSCHIPVEPGSRPRDVIEAAMQRHQKRAKLSQEEWRELVEFLAVTNSRTASAAQQP
ncbi:MAG: hypothetical protein U0441_38920 [Polyangiaceae bacterium]